MAVDLGTTTARTVGGRTRPAVPPVVVQALVVAGALVLWQVVVDRGTLGRALPGPVEVAGALAGEVATAGFWSALGATAAGWALGLLLAVLVAVPLGVLVGSTRFAFRSTRLTIDVLRTIPPVTLVPLAVLVYGPTLSMKLLLVVYGTVWPLLLQVVYAVREVDPVARDVARAYRLRPGVRFRAVLLPGAVPFLATGLRIAATVALLLSIGAEIIGDAPGLGRALTLAQLDGRAAAAYAYVAVAALAGLAVNAGLVAVTRRLLFWHGDVRRGVS